MHRNAHYADKIAENHYLLNKIAIGRENVNSQYL